MTTANGEESRSYEERVREKAHQVWIEEGRPEGRDRAHWDRARELVAIEDGEAQARPPQPSQEEVAAPAEAPAPPADAVEKREDPGAAAEKSAPRKRRRSP